MEPIKVRFFGRQSILQDLVEGLLALTQPLDFSLVGPKLIGKSRLLTYLASAQGPLKGPDPSGWRPERFRDGHNIIVGHYDCDWPAAQSHLTLFISQRLRAQLQAQTSFELDWSAVDSAPSPGQQIGQMVYQLNQKQIRLVLLLDNFDRIMRSENITPEMVNELRPLTSELGLVLATEQPLHDLNQRLAASPLFNIMHQHFVGLLEADAARAWVDGYSEHSPFTPEVKTTLLEMAGGHPFLLARINDILMEMKAQGLTDEPVSRDHFPLLHLRLTEHGRRLFEMNWRKLETDRGQAALPLVKKLIQAPIPIDHIPLEQSATLNWLINQAMVTFDERGYRIFSPLFAKYLAEQLDLDYTPSLPALDSERQDIFEKLPPKEAELLRYFQAHSGTIVSVEQLLADVWNQPDASPRRVQEAIRRLRNSLSKFSPPIGVIENERGVGYRYLPTER